MDYPKLAASLVKHVRGHRSQNSINRKLGYKHNQISKWELGTNAIKWHEFCKLCDVRGVNMAKVIAETFGFHSVSLQPNALLRQLFAGRSNSVVSRTIAKPVHLVQRWRRGVRELRLCVIIECIDKLNPGQLSTFLSHFMPTESIAVYLHRYPLIQEERHVAYMDPVISLIPYALELDEYKSLPRHCDSFVAQELDLNERDVHVGLATLLDRKVLHWTGSHFQNVRSEHIDLSMDLGGFSRLLQFHLERLASRIAQCGPERHKVSGFFNVCSVNDHGLEAINILNRQYYSQLMDLIEKHSRHATKTITIASIAMPNRIPVDEQSEKQGVPRSVAQHTQLATEHSITP